MTRRARVGCENGVNGDWERKGNLCRGVGAGTKTFVGYEKFRSILYTLALCQERRSCDFSRARYAAFR